MDDLYSTLGYIIGFITFCVTWLYAFQEWGVLVGLVLGWIPALIAGGIVGFLWPAIALFAVALFINANR